MSNVEGGPHFEIFEPKRGGKKLLYKGQLYRRKEAHSQRALQLWKCYLSQSAGIYCRAFVTTDRDLTRLTSESAVHSHQACLVDHVVKNLRLEKWKNQPESFMQTTPCQPSSHISTISSPPGTVCSSATHHPHQHAIDNNNHNAISDLHHKDTMSNIQDDAGLETLLKAFIGDNNNDNTAPTEAAKMSDVLIEDSLGKCSSDIITVITTASNHTKDNSEDLRRPRGFSHFDDFLDLLRVPSPYDVKTPSSSSSPCYGCDSDDKDSQQHVDEAAATTTTTTNYSSATPATTISSCNNSGDVSQRSELDGLLETLSHPMGEDADKVSRSIINIFKTVDCSKDGRDNTGATVDEAAGCFSRPTDASNACSSSTSSHGNDVCTTLEAGVYQMHNDSINHHDTLMDLDLLTYIAAADDNSQPIDDGGGIAMERVLLGHSKSTSNSNTNSTHDCQMNDDLLNLVISTTFGNASDRRVRNSDNMKNVHPSTPPTTIDSANDTHAAMKVGLSTQPITATSNTNDAHVCNSDDATKKTDLMIKPTTTSSGSHGCNSDNTTMAVGLLTHPTAASNADNTADDRRRHNISDSDTAAAREAQSERLTSSSASTSAACAALVPHAGFSYNETPEEFALLGKTPTAFSSRITAAALNRADYCNSNTTMELALAGQLSKELGQSFATTTNSSASTDNTSDYNHRTNTAMEFTSPGQSSVSTTTTADPINPDDYKYRSNTTIDLTLLLEQSSTSATVASTNAINPGECGYIHTIDSTATGAIFPGKSATTTNSSASTDNTSDYNHRTNTAMEFTSPGQSSVSTTTTADPINPDDYKYRSNTTIDLTLLLEQSSTSATVASTNAINPGDCGYIHTIDSTATGAIFPGKSATTTNSSASTDNTSDYNHRTNTAMEFTSPGQSSVSTTTTADPINPDDYKYRSNTTTIDLTLLLEQSSTSATVASTNAINPGDCGYIHTIDSTATGAIFPGKSATTTNSSASTDNTSDYNHRTNTAMEFTSPGQSSVSTTTTADPINPDDYKYRSNTTTIDLTLLLEQSSTSAKVASTNAINPGDCGYIHTIDSTTTGAIFPGKSASTDGDYSHHTNNTSGAEFTLLGQSVTSTNTVINYDSHHTNNNTTTPIEFTIPGQPSTSTTAVALATNNHDDYKDITTMAVSTAMSGDLSWTAPVPARSDSAKTGLVPNVTRKGRDDVAGGGGVRRDLEDLPLESLVPGTVVVLNKPIVAAGDGSGRRQSNPCGSCHNHISIRAKTVIQCRLGCGMWFHRRCVGLTPQALRLLQREPRACWACDDCLALVGGNLGTPPVLTAPVMTSLDHTAQQRHLSAGKLGSPPAFAVPDMTSPTHSARRSVKGDNSGTSPVPTSPVVTSVGHTAQRHLTERKLGSPPVFKVPAMTSPTHRSLKGSDRGTSPVPTSTGVTSLGHTAQCHLTGRKLCSAPVFKVPFMTPPIHSAPRFPRGSNRGTSHVPTSPVVTSLSHTAQGHPTGRKLGSPPAFAVPVMMLPAHPARRSLNGSNLGTSPVPIAPLTTSAIYNTELPRGR